MGLASSRAAREPKALGEFPSRAARGLPVSERQTVLLLPLEGRLDDLSGRLLLVHYRGRIASNLAEAERLLRSERPPIRAALVSSEPGVADLARTLQALREAMSRAHGR